MYEFFKQGTSKSEKEALRDAVDEVLEKHQETLGNADQVEEYTLSQQVDDQDLNITVQASQEERSLTKNPEIVDNYIFRLENRRASLVQQLANTLDLLKEGAYTTDHLKALELEDYKESLRKETALLAKDLLSYNDIYGESDVQHLDVQKTLSKYEILLKTLETIEHDITNLTVSITPEHEHYLQKRIIELAAEQQKIKKLFENPNQKTQGFEDPIVLN
jgi:hypothetical protein